MLKLLCFRIYELARNKEIKMTLYNKDYILTITSISDAEVPIEKLDDDCLEKIFSYFDTYEHFILEEGKN